ncbi:MAG TPA: ribosome biogenesis factor YjgA [Malonomonas sp.]
MEELPEENLPLSRTKKKQQAKGIEMLATQLTTLTEKQLAQLVLSDGLAKEVALVRATKGYSALKRQIKHLAGFLRKQDDELQSVQEQLEKLDQVSRGDRQDFHRLEELRDRLCALSSFDDAFNEMLDLYPQIDRKTISRLARSVHQHEDRRASREIFRRLRDEQEALADEDSD